MCNSTTVEAVAQQRVRRNARRTRLMFHVSRLSLENAHMLEKLRDANVENMVILVGMRIKTQRQ